MSENEKKDKTARDRSEIPNTCGDAISRKDTCNAIIKRLGIKDETFLLEAERAIYQQILAMPSVSPQQRTGRWVPVSERLPEKRGNYLVTQKASFTDYVYISVAGYALNLHDVDEYDFADKKRPGWYEYDGEWGYYEIDGVVAWMPLPEPYKPQESEDKK